MTEENSQISSLIDGLLRDNSPFAIFRRPAGDCVELVVPDKGYVVGCDLKNLGRHKGFLFAPFDLGSDEAPVVIIESAGAKKQNQTDFISSLSQRVEVKARLQSADDEGMLRYASVFDKFSAALQRQEFSKLVLARSKDFVCISELDPLAIFARAVARYPDAFVYLCNIPESGLWMGSTPEILLGCDGRECQTVALAGTVRIADVCNGWQWDEKNIEEQKYVADYIENRLLGLDCRVVRGSVHTAEAGNVAHLKTCFSFALPQGLDVAEVVKTLHPTPAVCGLPKEEAMHFIIGNEKTDRQYYSGFAGPLDGDGQMQLFVNIRCMRIGSEKVTLFAGGGLLAQSVMENEWKETENKMLTMLDIC